MMIEQKKNTLADKIVGAQQPMGERLGERLCERVRGGARRSRRGKRFNKVLRGNGKVCQDFARRAISLPKSVNKSVN
jgi:hypothetical protein